MFNPPTTNLDFELLGATYLPPATSTAIYYTHQNTVEGSPLRRLLADIFAFNVRPEMLDEDLLVLPAPFVADVLAINMKRLPLRLCDEKADFDISTEKYHVHDTSPERKSRMLRGKAHDEPSPEMAVDGESDLRQNLERSNPQAVQPTRRKERGIGVDAEFEGKSNGSADADLPVVDVATMDIRDGNPEGTVR